MSAFSIYYYHLFTQQWTIPGSFADKASKTIANIIFRHRNKLLPASYADCAIA